ncbi:hypothetical protein ABPG75_012660 [Micractinium tetrahymenae]
MQLPGPIHHREGSSKPLSDVLGPVEEAWRWSWIGCLRPGDPAAAAAAASRPEAQRWNVSKRQRAVRIQCRPTLPSGLAPQQISKGGQLCWAANYCFQPSLP